MAGRTSDGKLTKKSTSVQPKRQKTESKSESSGVNSLQQSVGNRAVQRILAQRSSGQPMHSEGWEVEDGTKARVNEERGQGQSVDERTQNEVGGALGYDFSEVTIHDNKESHELSRDLEARAFTTGTDVFFGEGEYNPDSNEGQELLAHELTHVVQQQSGQVDLGGSGMRVNDPDDSYEKQADQVAARVVAQPGQAEGEYGTSAGENASVQRADMEEMLEEKPLQRADMEEMIEEKPIQRVDMEEMIEEKPIQRVDMEEMIEEKPIQRADMEEMIEEKPIQRADMEEMIEEKPIQRADMEEMIEEKPIQRADMEEMIEEKPIQRVDMEEMIEEKPIQRDDAVEESLLQKPKQRAEAA
ncbi:MAG: DUF4157 domain-containing protein [Chloroflexota bacterium]